MEQLDGAPDRAVNSGDSRSLTGRRARRLTFVWADQQPGNRSLPSWSCRFDPGRPLFAPAQVRAGLLTPGSRRPWYSRAWRATYVPHGCSPQAPCSPRSAWSGGFVVGPRTSRTKVPSALAMAWSRSRVRRRAVFPGLRVSRVRPLASTVAHHSRRTRLASRPSAREPLPTVRRRHRPRSTHGRPSFKGSLCRCGMAVTRSPPRDTYESIRFAAAAMTSLRLVLLPRRRRI